MTPVNKSIAKEVATIAWSVFMTAATWICGFAGVVALFSGDYAKCAAYFAILAYATRD
jgi:hypothetical protein